MKKNKFELLNTCVVPKTRVKYYKCYLRMLVCYKIFQETAVDRKINNSDNRPMTGPFGECAQLGSTLRLFNVLCYNLKCNIIMTKSKC